jgi:hypothetical protein
MIVNLRKFVGVYRCINLYVYETCINLYVYETCMMFHDEYSLSPTIIGAPWLVKPINCCWRPRAGRRWEGWWHLIRGVWSFQPLFGFNNFCYNNDFRGTENMCLMMYMIYLCLEVVWWIFWYCQYVFLSRTGMINLCFYPIGSDDLKSDCPLVL